MTRKEAAAVVRGLDPIEIELERKARWLDEPSLHPSAAYRDAIATRLEALPQEESVDYKAHADMLARALRLTQEYVGDQLLPPRDGWSWYDALQKHKSLEPPTRQDVIAEMRARLAVVREAADRQNVNPSTVTLLQGLVRDCEVWADALERTEVTGEGETQDDPVRVVRQYWSLDGKLLAGVDDWKARQPVEEGRA